MILPAAVILYPVRSQESGAPRPSHRSWRCVPTTKQYGAHAPAPVSIRAFSPELRVCDDQQTSSLGRKRVQKATSVIIMIWWARLHYWTHAIRWQHSGGIICREMILRANLWLLNVLFFPCAGCCVLGQI